MPAKYVRPYSKGQKNDFRESAAIAEAVQRLAQLCSLRGTPAELARTRWIIRLAAWMMLRTPPAERLWRRRAGWQASINDWPSAANS
jgi:hypothetical protein